MTDVVAPSGPELFARYAVPPNLLGYCGPQDVRLLQDLLDEDAPPLDELAHAARMFDGAYPYLELIGGVAKRDPLDRDVVEAYWIGSRLLRGIDTLIWGNAVDDRFRARAGGDWDAVKRSFLSGGVPTHAFHVFCVYPWVGLLRSGAADPALTVLDRCRISWGEVVEVGEKDVQVRSSRLEWIDGRLRLAGPTIEALAPGAGPVAVDDVVSLHWGTICERLTAPRLDALRRYHDVHLEIANDTLKR